MVILCCSWAGKIHPCARLAIQGNKRIVLVAQKERRDGRPQADDPDYAIGRCRTSCNCCDCRMARSRYWWKAASGWVSTALPETQACFIAEVSLLESVLDERNRGNPGVGALLLSTFDQYVKLNKNPWEVLTSVSGIDDPSRLADTIAAHGAQAG